jgi:hypothetical protein
MKKLNNNSNNMSSIFFIVQFNKKKNKNNLGKEILEKGYQPGPKIYASHA